MLATNRGWLQSRFVMCSNIELCLVAKCFGLQDEHDALTRGVLSSGSVKDKCSPCCKCFSSGAATQGNSHLRTINLANNTQLTDDGLEELLETSCWCCCLRVKVRLLVRPPLRRHAVAAARCRYKPLPTGRRQGAGVACVARQAMRFSKREACTCARSHIIAWHPRRGVCAV